MTLRNIVVSYLRPVFASSIQSPLNYFRHCSLVCDNTQRLRKMSANKGASIVRFQDGKFASKIPISSKRVQNSFPTSGVDPSDPVQIAKAVFFQGLQNVMPSRLINAHVQLQGSLLKLANDEETTIDLSQYNRKYVIGFGKGCLPMAESLLSLLNGLIDRCIVSIPNGSRASIDSNIEVHLGAEGNIPDEDSFAASQAIVELVRSCTRKDLLIVLISGGGSALLPYPIPPITLDEKKELIKSLSKAGSTIHELNTVRKRISLVKGGGLVNMCQASKILSLIVSDVTGNPLDIISSGPTVENLDSPQAALKIIEKYNLKDDLPSSIHNIITRPPTINRVNFDKVTNFIIGDNRLALEAASTAATQLGLHPYIVTTSMSGVASEVGYDIACVAEALAYCTNHDLTNDPNGKAYMDGISKVFKHNNWPLAEIIPEVVKGYERLSITKGVCLLFGGETTVIVHGTGIGGRNQELALAAGIRLDSSRNVPHLKNKVAILCAGTDGIDGPTDAAGGVVEGCTIHKAQCQGISPVEFLKDNNSYEFFRNVANGKFHIVCGHTETNVMDVVVLVILNKHLQLIENQKSML